MTGEFKARLASARTRARPNNLFLFGKKKWAKTENALPFFLSAHVALPPHIPSLTGKELRPVTTTTTRLSPPSATFLSLCSTAPPFSLSARPKRSFTGRASRHHWPPPQKLSLCDRQASEKIEDAKLARDFQTTLQEFQKVQQLASERETTYTPAARNFKFCIICLSSSPSDFLIYLH